MSTQGLYRTRRRLQRPAMKSTLLLRGTLIAVFLLDISSDVCSAYSCRKPPGGCPPPTTEKTIRLFFFDPMWGGCIDIETSGCGPYGWPSLYHCKFFCNGPRLDQPHNATRLRDEPAAD
ncbi:uncharacterized protein LOC144100846 [Amblyomma americanum]